MLTLVPWTDVSRKLTCFPRLATDPIRLESPPRARILPDDLENWRSAGRSASGATPGGTVITGGACAMAMNSEGAEIGRSVVPTVIAVAVLGVALALAVVGVSRRGPGAHVRRRVAYDLTAYSTTDPALLLYEELASIPLAVAAPCAVAVGPAGTVHVAGESELVVFSPDGSRLWQSALAAPARCVTVDADGATLVGTARHIEVYGPDGVRREVDWPLPAGDAVLTSIAAGPAGVFAADAANRCVWRYSVNGRALGALGTTGEAADSFVVPSPYFDVAVAPDGALWTANPGRLQVEKRDVAGRVVARFGTAAMSIDGFCGCCNPTHIAVLPDGALITSEKGLPRVKQYGADGHFAGVVAGVEQFAEGTVGLDMAVDSSGRVLVLDPRRRAIRVFAPRAQARGARSATDSGEALEDQEERPHG